MTILIANIGTSDLSIKVDEYYFPVGFDRSEPNIDDLGLTDNEKNVWEQELRQSYITTLLCPELGININEKGKFSFRELTLKILQSYQQDEEFWHHRICPCRIWGVIKAAMQPKYAVTKAYIFVTDQPITEKQGYPSDSIHLFDILQKWFQREIPDLILKKELIPHYIPANDQDQLLNYYYQFFNRIDREETVLISLKGGTPQMQTSLKIQAIASGTAKQLFINPKLSIQKVLAGQPSECLMTSYWRYMRSQRYQTVKLLLETRWDFDGAQQILQDWKKVLNFLINEKVADEAIVLQSKKILEQIIQALELGLDFLNLDYESAGKILRENSQLAQATDLDSSIITHGDEKLLNLYTQSRIYWEIDQMANFLARISSFYEEVLERLVFIFKGENYFQRDWELNTALVRQQMGERLWQEFYNAEEKYNFELKSHDFNKKPIFKLKGRFTQRNFLEKLLVPHHNIPISQWELILESLKSLDFWVTQRNYLIHSASGVSKKRMQELLDNSLKKGLSESIVACKPGKIRSVMAKICSSELGIVRAAYHQKFVGQNADFYLYSDVRNFVLDQLQIESSK
jgi:hypothetical protein